MVLKVDKEWLFPSGWELDIESNFFLFAGGYGGGVNTEPLEEE